MKIDGLVKGKSRILDAEHEYMKKYFDELNVTNAERVKRVRVAKAIAKKMDAFFIEWLLLILMGTFLGAIADGTLVDELFDYYMFVATGAMNGSFDNSEPSETTLKKMVSTDDKEVIAKAHRFSKYIIDTTQKAYENAVGNERFNLSRDMGTRISEEDVPDTVLNVLSAHRAVDIAVNESGWIFNYITHKDLVKRGNRTHTWISERDNKVRPTHAEADGQTVLINEPFIVGGYKMMFPLDDQFNAPPEEICSCRCTEL